MKSVLHSILRGLLVLPFLGASLSAEPVTLQHAVELALKHSTVSAIAGADEQHAFATYLEARNNYIPQVALGSGLGNSWGYPLSLEGSAPSILNVSAQSPLINYSLRDMVRAARTDWQATALQTKDQRAQVIQDTVLSYAELCKWQALLSHLQDQQSAALKGEEIVKQRIEAGIDSAIAAKQARLNSAQVRLRMAQAQSSIEILRERLGHFTGLPAASIDGVPESIPALQEVKQEDPLAAQSVQASPAVKAAETRANASDFRARGEHRAMWPTIDFAAQYALLATFNNYQDFFRPGSFQQHNATVGVVIRLPFLNMSQRAHAKEADADAVRARKQVEAAKNQVSEETLRLQRSVDQLAAAQEVADLQYQIAQSNAESVQTRLEAGTGTWHDLADAATQSSERYNALQDANFDLQRAKVALLRATGELETWVGSSASH